MLQRVWFAGVLIAMTAVPAVADMSCGSEPLAPSIPAIGELAGKTPDDAHNLVLDALKHVRTYQANLGTYRKCLKAQEDIDMAALDAAKVSGDKAKIAAAKAQVQAVIDVENKTIDTEQQVATDYNNLHAAYCNMGTGLTGCAK
jgi:hypothetical protein